MTLSVNLAKEMAEKAHGDRRDKLGYNEFDHIERVANGVSQMARPVAYWHDAVEDGLISFRTAFEHMDSTQFYALLLVTREKANGFTYHNYIRAIRAAYLTQSASGLIAYEIKDVDLDDNMTRSCPPEMMGMREPGGRYHTAKRILHGEIE